MYTKCFTSELFKYQYLDFWLYLLIPIFITGLLGLFIYQFDLRCSEDIDSTSSIFGHIWVLSRPTWPFVFIMTMIITSSILEDFNDYAKWKDQYEDIKNQEEYIEKMKSHADKKESFFVLTKEIYGEDALQKIKNEFN